jgi:hypothetical protein
MDDSSPLNRNQLSILDFVEKNPGCLFEALLDHMIAQKINWQDWFPHDYKFLQDKQLIIRDFWPQPDAQHPNRKPGNVKLFPNLSVLDTDYENEPLSDDAKAMLAFIRDHPGLGDLQIMEKLKLDETRFVMAFRLLRAHKLIKQHFVPMRNHPDPNVVPGHLTFYPT